MLRTSISNCAIQTQTGPQYRRVRRADGRGGGLKGICLGSFAGKGNTIAENGTVEPVFSQSWPERLIIALLVPRWWWLVSKQEGGDVLALAPVVFNCHRARPHQVPD